MTQDQVFVPSTRSQLGLPPFDPTREDLLGSRVTEEVQKELWEALGDSPIGAVLGPASYLVSISEPKNSTADPYFWHLARWMARIHYSELLWSTKIP